MYVYYQSPLTVLISQQYPAFHSLPPSFYSFRKMKHSALVNKSFYRLVITILTTLTLAYTANIHNNVDTGASRSAGTSIKASLLQTCQQRNRIHLITILSITKYRRSYRKCIRQRRIRKPKTTLVPPTLGAVVQEN